MKALLRGHGANGAQTVGAIVNDIQAAIGRDRVAGDSLGAVQEPTTFHPRGERCSGKLFANALHPLEKFSTESFGRKFKNTAERARVGGPAVFCACGVFYFAVTELRPGP